MRSKEIAQAMLNNSMWSSDEEEDQQQEVNGYQEHLPKDAKVPLPVAEYLLTNNPSGVVCDPPVRMNIVII